MPAIWAAKLITVAIVDFTEIYYFVGRKRVLENHITVLAKMWEECLEVICRLGVGHSSFLSKNVCEELSFANYSKV